MYSRSIGTGRVTEGELSLRPNPFVAEDPEQFHSNRDKEDMKQVSRVGIESDVVASRSDARRQGAQSIIGYEEPIVLTQSTHSFLFTEPTCSIPFAFALGIVAISYTCLILALHNNLEGNSPSNRLNVPVSVSMDVRVAQYFALLIGLIMEEETPESLYLLRMITENTLHNKAPDLKFGRFVFCACVRIITGYLFYFNMFVVVAQATGVIDIFYDVLALQFLLQVDKIAFRLAKWDVFGKLMKRASTRKCFRAEFEKLPYVRRKRMTIFVKLLYGFNFLILMVGMTAVARKQRRGDYHCDSITVRIEDRIWQNAVVLNSTGGVEEMYLMYSYFNGVYVLNETLGLHDGRPIYTEQNKFNHARYEEKIGAKIIYCKTEGAWVFMHENIRKDRNTRHPGCPWLLRSPNTKSFNLLEVSGDWSIWTGIINTATFQATCNECKLDSEADCNYHGTCISENSESSGKCACDSSEDDGYPLYSGEHCEFARPCIQLIGDSGAVWNLIPIEEKENEYSSWKAYGRGVYIYRGSGEIQGTATDFEEDDLVLMYTGSRWFGSYYRGGKQLGLDYWLHYSRELHAFWDQVYETNTYFVSNPTSHPDPIAVDFFQIGRRGEKYGPLGELIPLSDPPGSGFFTCPGLNMSINDFVLQILEEREGSY
mmetsp:Transcript_15754/g.33903  ORF Transcript_15754/g.33903 Transcript_15754/m.33903 type:complete len:654 (+) Transcript_15754:159-2120(+)